MKLPITIRKHKLRLSLGILAFILPVLLPLGRLLLGGNPVFLRSISSYYYSEVQLLFLVILILFGLAFTLYGSLYSRARWVLLTTGVVTLCVAFFPTVGPGVEQSWVSHFHVISAVAFFFLLGYVTRYTFNLPMPFPLLTKLGIYIWIVEGVLVIYFLAFKSLWPPLVFILETLILWMFSSGIYMRWQIDKRLRGGK